LEIRPVNFYKTEYLSNTLYLVQMAIENFFSKSVFRNDPTRVLYADSSNCFRERVRRLKETGHTDYDSLDLPFMSYYNSANWVPDERMGLLSAKGALMGFSEATLGYQKLRFINTKVTFGCYAFFNSYLDAQLAYETILWADKPGPLQFSMSSVTYNGYDLDIPVSLAIENLTFNPETQQKDFFSRKKVYPIKFDITIRSISFSQKPQPEGSSIFEDSSPPVLTQKVILDFLNYKYTDAFWDKSNPVLEVQRALGVSAGITPTLTVDQITENSIRVSWYVDPEALDELSPNIRLSLNSVTNLDMPLSLGSYVVEGLNPESTYNITLWVYALDGRVDKTTTTATTSNTAPLFLKGIKGY